MVHYPPIFRLQADVERRADLLRRLEERLSTAVEDAAVAAPARKSRYQHRVKLWTVDVERARTRLAKARRYLKAAIDQHSADTAAVPGHQTSFSLDAVQGS